MAKNTFRLVGKIQLGKETEKFKPHKISKSAKGWIGHRLTFGLKNITGFHNLEMFEGYMENGSSLVYCIQKKEKYSDETVRLQIKWADRNRPEVIENVSEFNKMSLNLGEGNVTKYIAGFDFLQDVLKVLKNEENKDKLFVIEGDVNYQAYEGRVYRKLNPRHISLAEEGTKEESTLKLELHYTQDAVDETMFEDTKKYIVNAYVPQYNSETKSDDFFLEPVVIDVSKAENDKQVKAFNIIKNRFKVDEEKVVKMGVKTVLINGKERKQITFDDLTEEEQDLIDCGLATLEEISAEYGNTINGDTVSEIKVVGFGYGYNKGSQDTEIEVSRLLGYEEDLTDGMFEEEVEEDLELPFM